MKKLIALTVSAVMAATMFSGCTETDMALWKALEASSKAENTVTTLTLKPKLEITEPIVETYIDDGDTYSYFSKDDEASVAEEETAAVNMMADFIKDLTVTVSTAKDNDKISVNILAAKPDIEAEARLWAETGEDYAKLTAKSPYLFEIGSEVFKDYLTIDSRTLEKAGGEDSVMKKVEIPEIDLSPIVETVDYSLVKSASEENGLTVYAVELNDSVLDGLTEEFLSKLGGSAAVNLASALISSQLKESGQDVSLQNVKDEINSVIPQAEEARKAFFEELKSSGLLKNGLTLNYYVNKNGLIEKIQGQLRVDIDMNTEVVKYIFDELFWESRYFDTAGKLRLTVDFSESCSYGGAKVELPETTEENSVDIGVDYAEYSKYQKYMDEELPKWNNNHPSDEYAKERNPYSPITFKNLENGKEIVLAPGLVSDDTGIAFPLTELCSIMDNVEVRWNDKTFGLEIEQEIGSDYFGPYKRINYIPNQNGELLLEQYMNASLSEELEEIFRSYFYGCYMVGGFYFDENGKSYIDFDALFSGLGYICKLEGNTVSFVGRNMLWETLSEGMEDNFFYALENNI